MPLPPDPHFKNKKALVSTFLLGQEPYSLLRYHPTWLAHSTSPLVSRTAMRASLVTGEAPVAPNRKRNQVRSGSDCPRKSIRHRRRCCDPTIRSSLCAPETIPTTLTQRFCCSICFHCMRQGGFCQEYSAKKFSAGRPACQAFYILTESRGRGMLTDRERSKIW